MGPSLPPFSTPTSPPATAVAVTESSPSPSANLNDRLDSVSLKYINDNYHQREGDEYLAKDEAWEPQHRLCFDRTTEETKAVNRNLQVEVMYDIDALKGVSTLQNFGLALSTSFQLMQPLQSRQFLTGEKQLKVILRREAGTRHHAVEMKNISTLPSTKIGKMMIEGFGEASLYLIFDDDEALEAPEVGERRRQRYRDQFVSAIQASILTALRFRCNGNHEGHVELDTSELRAVQALFILTLEGLATVSAPRFRPIPAKFIACFCHCLSEALPTTYGNPYVLLHTIGNKGDTQVSTVEKLDQVVESITKAINPIPFLSFDVDVGARRWTYGGQENLTTWATRSSMEDQDVGARPYRRCRHFIYPRMLTYDLIGYQANYTILSGGSQRGLRGFIKAAKYYSSMRQQLAVFGKYPLSGLATLPGAYGLQHLYPVLNGVFGDRIPLTTDESLVVFRDKLRQLNARLDSLRTSDIPYRFELSVPIQFTNGAAQYLRYRASQDQDFWLMPSNDLVTRFTSLYHQAYHEIKELFDSQPRAENAVKVSVLEDMIRRGIPDGFFWGGTSELRSVLKDMPVFQNSIARTNLPSWKFLLHTEPALSNEEVRFQRLIEEIGNKFSLPNFVNMTRLLRTLWIKFTPSNNLSQQLDWVVNLYLQDLADIVRGTDHAGNELLQS